MMKKILLLLPIAAAVLTVANTQTVQVDVQRNVPGTNATSIVVADNSPDPTNIYFIVTGSVTGIRLEKDTQTLANINMYPISGEGGESTFLTVVSIDPGFTNYGTWSIVDNNGVISTVNLVEQTEIILFSCLNNQVHLKLPDRYSNHFLSLENYENNPSCSFQLGDLTTNNNIHLNMGDCGIYHNSPFQISVRQSEHFNVDEDAFILMQCYGTDTVLSVTSLGVSSTLDDITGSDFLATVSALMYLHTPGDTSAVLSNNVLVNTPVSLTISMDPLYRHDFDILPIECFVNNYKIVNFGCASWPLSNFTKLETGVLSSEFKMFRPVINGVPENNVSFMCTLQVCDKGYCPTIPCITGSKK